MYRSASLAVTMLLLPFLAHAAQAGFPPQSVWLSNNKPAQGEKVRIYAVIYNGTDAKTDGVVTFLVDGKTHEAKSLSLDAGQSSVAYSSWTAAEGEHSFSARFAGVGTEESAAQVSVAISATVSAPPTAVEQTISQAKDVGSQIASTSLPIISTIANKVFTATESLRNAGIAYFEDSAEPAAISSVAADSSTGSAVLGTTTVNQTEGFQKPAAASSSASGIFGTIKHTASVGALVILRSMWLFYPALVAFLLLIFRWLHKWATRPRF